MKNLMLQPYHSTSTDTILLFTVDVLKAMSVYAHYVGFC